MPKRKNPVLDSVRVTLTLEQLKSLETASTNDCEGVLNSCAVCFAEIKFKGEQHKVTCWVGKALEKFK